MAQLQEQVKEWATLIALLTDPDPRAPNCRAFHTREDGKVDGVELAVQVNTLTPFRLLRVALIDEANAMGNTVATCQVVDAQGLPLGDQVSMAWPWPEPTEFALPGNPNGQHPITNGYNPPEMGPLALCLRDAQGNIASDVVGGLGLPWNRHVCYLATWQQRAAVPEPVPEPEPEAGDDLTAAVTRIAAALERLADHLGA